MFLINDLKRVINNNIVIIFLIISYILIFRTSKELKRNNLHRDCKIVKFTGIVYGLLAIAAAIVINR
ncbi:CLC_0170 family protein [Sedimentibacter sp. MB31-C6]|uniref:CLC_0170 family protein n=1 Tax=Sedimentibacter sp. MB31-C6 TaxID=3109366 RepID=UPI002DDD041D|nr:CLC_0170 family protein [Sedimentibacter sp. MB36-C1]WSI05421.1 CLC_0170 family protein [Sedimentibacter sp. MB36-C1]